MKRTKQCSYIINRNTLSVNMLFAVFIITSGQINAFYVSISQVKLRKNLFPQEMNFLFCCHWACLFFSTASARKNFYHREKSFSLVLFVRSCCFTASMASSTLLFPKYFFTRSRSFALALRERISFEAELSNDYRKLFLFFS